MSNKPALTSVAIHPLIAKRWSPRAFAPDRPVSAEDLTALLEAARWAPSCFNDQPWRFVVCDKSTHPDAWARALEIINDKNRLWARHAPVLILSVAMANFNHNGQANRWAMYDTGAAALNLCLQAGALGLASHQMGGFDAAAARQAFGLPEQCTPMAMLAIGYQADAEELPEEFRTAELAVRSRAELRQRAYFGHWDE
ncbi:nitroreductase family protein [Methylomonas sp. MED-D]|uniref:nitroreductase family protein n=1 Tax=unclassified Methylomonas TaxID=2608980 RepID=UPI0028A3A4D6|nr:nitroreductase family protein [Methylomonas sp. MV1]MDT4330411.1 nitroreductase family protein [Methylomonas sp. MV1]